MGKGQFLGEFEQMVLLAVARLSGDAYGAMIRQEVERRTERSVSVGAIYATLDRLQAKGYLTAREGSADPDRGGRPRRYFTLDPAGVTALQASRRMHDRMWEGVTLEGGASQ
jgi:DNA-binding PadR family transcriptional regulator